MSEQTSQLELKRILAQKIALPQNVIDAFVDQLFIEIEKSIIDDSYLKLEGIGLFRIIKSGASNKILFLGSNQPVEEALDVSKFRKEVDNLLPEDVKIDTESLGDEHALLKETQQLTTIDELGHKSGDIDQKMQFSPENITPPSSKKRKFSFIKMAVLAIVSVVSLSICIVQNKSEKKIAFTTNFIELENSDPLNFNYIIIPESDVSLEYISKTYYGSVDFWPYIYTANEDFVNNHLVIQAGSIIKIPKIMIDIIDYQNGTAVTNAKKIGEKIRQEKNIN